MDMEVMVRACCHGPWEPCGKCARCLARDAAVDHAFEREPALHPIRRHAPRIIALCGNPGAGKSEVQRILEERHGVTPADDGWPLRDFAIRHFKLSEADVYTQAGKNRLTRVMDADYKNRDIMGRIGNSLEKEFGDHILPWLACQALDPDKAYSFGSVRRDQGLAYQALGGVVIGIRKPGVGPSEFEFDRFDESIVDVWINNDGTLDHLAVKVTYALQVLRGKVPSHAEWQACGNT